MIFLKHRSPEAPKIVMPAGGLVLSMQKNGMRGLFFELFSIQGFLINDIFFAVLYVNSLVVFTQEENRLYFFLKGVYNGKLYLLCRYLCVWCSLRASVNGLVIHCY